MRSDALAAWPGGVALPDLGPDRSATWLTDRPRPVLLALAGTAAAALTGVLAVHQLALGIAFVLGTAVVVMVLLRPAVGGLLLVGGVPVLSGLLTGIPIPHLRLSEALIGAVGVTVLVSARRRDALAWERLDWALLVYGLGWLLFAALDAQLLHQDLGLTGWGTALGQLQFFLLYRGVRVSLRTTAERRLAMKVLLAASIPVVTLAVLQQLHAPGVDAFIIKITGGPDQGAIQESITRATGPFANWAALAGYVLPVLVVMVAFAFARVAPRRRWCAPVLLTVAVVGLLVTAEISAIVCAVAGAVVLGVLYGQTRRLLRWLGIAALVLAVVGGPFLAGRYQQQFGQDATHHSAVPQTLGYRGQVWSQQYIPAIEHRPMLGYGVELPASINWPFPESQYIAELTEGGVPMLVLFALLMVAMIAQGKKIGRSNDPFERAVGRALVVVVVSLVLMDVVWPFVSNGGLPQVLWSMFALVSPLAAAPTRASAAPAIPAVGR